MSLLMDALRKAEIAKQKTPDDTRTSFAELGASLSLEPVEPKAEFRERTNETGTASAPEEATHFSGLPALPDRLEDLDDQFTSSAAPMAIPARLLATEPKQQPDEIESPPQEVAGATITPRPRQDDRQLTPPTLRGSAEPESSVLSPAPPPASPPVPPPPTMPAAVVATSEQAAIKNLFDAKAPPANSNRRFLLGLGVTSFLAAIGIGGYFWWELQPKSSMVALRPLPTGGNSGLSHAPPPAGAPPAATPASPPGPSATPAVAMAATTATTGAVPPAPTSVVPPTLTTPGRANDTADEADAEPRKPARKPAAIRPVAEAPPASNQAANRDTEAGSPEKNVRISKTPLRVNPVLGRAYEAFGRGDMASARRDYEAVLKTEPQNTDALHGMAAIALRENRPAAADDYYQRVLVANPQDPVATAALANLHGSSDPVKTESRLKSFVAAQPEQAAPLFALGNTQAAQGHWNEAQQSYFKAYALEPHNPDILFNLAVSLEQLRQGKLAVKYYSLALDAAEKSHPGFDRELVRSRLRALQP